MFIFTDSQLVLMQNMLILWMPQRFSLQLSVIISTMYFCRVANNIMKLMSLILVSNATFGNFCRCFMEQCKVFSELTPF